LYAEFIPEMFLLIISDEELNSLIGCDGRRTQMHVLVARMVAKILGVCLLLSLANVMVFIFLKFAFAPQSIFFPSWFLIKWCWKKVNHDFFNFPLLFISYF
jgi:hypothetical protein